MNSDTRATHIKMVIFDVDGVLTGGQIIFGVEGELMKQFHAHDGLGITAAHMAGLKTAIITCRESSMVHLRSRELNIGDVCQGAASKQEAFYQLLDKYMLKPEQVAYVGDDLNDLPLMSQSGLACAPANAVSEVKACAHYIAGKQGGDGAVREIVEYILKAQGKWDEIVKAYQIGTKVKTQQ